MGPLIHVYEHLNKSSYLNKVANHVHRIMLMVYLNGVGYFQQDNASFHRAGNVKDWFGEYEGDFTLLRWRSNSPDINPIELLWDEVERIIRHLDSQPFNLTLFKCAIHQAC